MSKPVTEVLWPVSQTSFWLALQLGSARQWPEALSDMRKMRGHIPGTEALLPAGEVQSRCGVPMYRPADVERFIAEARSAFGTNHPFEYEPIEYVYTPVDPVDPSKYWRLQRAARA